MWSRDHGSSANHTAADSRSTVNSVSPLNLGDLAMFATVVIWASHTIITKAALGHIGAVPYVFCRFVIVSMLLSTILPLKHFGRLKILGRALVLIGVGLSWRSAAMALPPVARKASMSLAPGLVSVEIGD